jgi:hypothetical protein
MRPNFKRWIGCAWLIVYTPRRMAKKNVLVRMMVGAKKEMFYSF